MRRHIDAYICGIIYCIESRSSECMLTVGILHTILNLYISEIIANFYYINARTLNINLYNHGRRINSGTCHSFATCQKCFGLTADSTHCICAVTTYNVYEYVL